MERPCQTVLNAESMTYTVEPVRFVGFFSRSLGELCVVICQYGVNLIPQLLLHVFEELSRPFPLCLAIELRRHELGGAINDHEQIRLAHSGTNLADMHL